MDKKKKNYVYVHTYRHCIGESKGKRLYIEAVKYYSTEAKALAAKAENGGSVSKDELL